MPSGGGAAVNLSKRPKLAAVPETPAIGAYARLVEIIRQNEVDVLGGCALTYDAMSGEILIGTKPLDDVGVDRISESIETKIFKANGKAMKASATNTLRAIRQVAHEASFHPVRNYLQALKWDGKNRIDKIAPELFGANQPVSAILVRRFFVGAIARPMSPGCKLDTALILVGGQGQLKSTTFSKLAGPFYTDSPVSIGSKDAYEVLRRCWIVELAELEGLRRARDVEAIKVFLSSMVDIYRPSYGRLPIKVPRTGIIVGTTNNAEFLTDTTGNRRFWPVEVTKKIDVERIERERDQIWAEARAMYEAGEPWWLTPDEEQQVSTIHKEHELGDAWEEAIIDWASGRTQRFTTGAVLGEALGKEKGTWTRSDEMRVAAVLTRNGFVNRGPGTKSNGVRYWRASDAL